MTYYLSTGGSDSNDGSFSHPWYSLNYAWTQLVPGDMLLVRGDNFITAPITLQNKHGLSTNPILIANYPGERPVFDYTSYNPNGSMAIGLRLQYVSYVNLQGLRFTGLSATNNNNGNWCYGFFPYEQVNNCIFVQIETDHIGGPGSVLGTNCHYLLYQDCDSHHNADPLASSPYDGGDGFESGSNGALASSNITYRGCRAWWNCDDGWDLRQASGVYTFENCWAFWNGYIPDTFTGVGNGIGFKLAGTYVPSDHSAILRTIFNSLAVHNRYNGIDAQYDDAGDYVGMNVYNNTAFGNEYVGIRFETHATGGTEHLRNNLSYGNGSLDYQLNAAVDHQYNDCDLAVTVTDADFVSVDPSELIWARQADGSLPIISFMHLAAGSDLIAAGVDVGLATDGEGKAWNSPPSLGAYEYGSSPPPPAIPVTGISIDCSSPTIDTDGGTKQMTATVLPVDASDPTIVWSVIPGTGTASISGSGLLTALTDGDVTVRATAHDGSGIYDDCVVTLSNQFILPVPTKTLVNSGWHIPTLAEWNTLVTYLGGDAVAGGRLKEIGFVHWDSPNTGADNSSGFTFLGTGFRDGTDGSFVNRLEIGFIWFSTIFDAVSTYFGLTLYNDAITLNTSIPNQYGLSVRAIKDDSNDPGYYQDVDGTVYPTIKIGNQVWMKSNLKVTRFTDLTPIPEVTDDAAWVVLTTAARCWYNNIPE